MAEPMIPAGAFAAMKSGAAMPSAAPKAVEAPKAAVAPKAEPKADAKPEPKAETSEAPKDLTPAEKKIWKLKADGEEFEFDATDEENVKRAIMKVKGSEKRIEDATKVRRQAEEFIDGLRDPARLRQILQDPRIGIDLKKFAEDYVWEQIQEEKMSPEERASRDKDAELKRYKDKEAKDAEDKQSTAKREEQKRHEQSYEEKIQKALESGRVAKTPEAVKTMAHYLYIAAEQGLDLSPEDLVEQVNGDMRNNTGLVLGQLSGQALLDFIGEAKLEEIRKTDLARLKDPQGNPFPSRSSHKQAANGREQPAPKRVSGSVWKDDLIKDFLSRK